MRSDAKVHFVAILLVSLFVPAATSCQDDFVEPWEHRLNAIQPPDKVMNAMGVEPGMVIGEVGAGTGRYTIWLAKRVGEDGLIYANDIDKNALDHLQARCERLGLGNVKIIQGGVIEPGFPENSLDIAFMINVYHHLDDRIALLRNIIPALKPGGILAIVENDPAKSGASEHSATARDEFAKQVGEAGFEVVRVETFLVRDNIYILRVRKPSE
ncbi:MAG TPA: methyltransferase domain-containing protein [Acidobacteriota bacterium]|nr:methyltransferase domain-containing protein [Acidobacteriota bacterium]